MRRVLIPKENARELAKLAGLEVVPVANVEQILRELPKTRRG